MTQIQGTGGSENALSSLLPLLICPTCRNTAQAFSVAAKSLECPDCQTTFPVYKSGQASIPWLFADPGSTLLEWKARFNGYLHANLADQDRLKNALRDERIGKIGRKRIDNILRAKKDQRMQISQLLAPLELDDIDFGRAPDLATWLSSKLPKNQGISSYYSNIFRDWSWNNGENEALLGAVESVLSSDQKHRLGKVLTLGGGAGRLSYDIHRTYSPDLSVVVDINPVLMFLASRVIHGEKIQLYEFPIAPLNKASFAVLQECIAPEAIDSAPDGNFLFAFADAMNPPFEAGSFDTVLTPWFIDIIPQDLRDFIRRVNRVLKKGGVWLNTGSLAFFHKDETWCYSEEEVLELLNKNGFEVFSAERSPLPYLQSPLSAHGRTENVFSFSARKNKDSVSPLRYEYLPQWILHSDQAVPDLPEFVVSSSSYLLKAQVLAAIDGKRTIDEIGLLVAKHYGLQVDQATNAVKRILVEAYESSVVQEPGALSGLE